MFKKSLTTIFSSITNLNKLGILFAFSGLVISNPLLISPALANSSVIFTKLNSNSAKDAISLTSQSIPSAQSKTKSFAQWCQEKDTLSAVTVKTITSGRLRQRYIAKTS